MLWNIARKLRDRRENGSADMIAALAITPIVMFLLIGVINAGIWMNAKSHVEATTRDGARLAAMWGGAGKTRLNPTGQTVPAIITDRLWDGKTCTSSHCTQKPVVSCTPSSASSAGTKISCTVTYYYKSIPGARLFSFVPQGAMKYTSSAFSETGYQ